LAATTGSGAFGASCAAAALDAAKTAANKVFRTSMAHSIRPTF
jgi:hypothetical protein